MKIKLVFLSTLFALSTSCLRELPRQRAKEIFQSGQRPAAAEAVSNPKVGDEDLQEKFFALDIAVIDGGVDYTHPELKRQIKFSRDSQNNWGTGRDVLGHDPWPHPNNAVNSVFAFGATLENGLIVNPLPDPLETLDKINTEFIELLQARLRGKQHQHFGKVNNLLGDYLHILGARYLYLKRTELLEKYKQSKSTNDTWTSTSTLISDTPSAFVEHYLLDRGAFRMSSSGIPENPARSLYNIAGFETFINVVADTYEEFSRAWNFRWSYLEPYFEFRKTEDPTNTLKDSVDLHIEYGEELIALWRQRYQQSGFEENPLIAVSNDFCKDYVGLEGVKDLRESGLGFRRAYLKRVLLELIGQVERYNAIVAASKIAPLASRSQAEKQADRLLKLSEAYKQLLESDSVLDSFDCSLYLNNANFRLGSSVDVKYYRETGNPYLHSQTSVSNSHGTHVSGIIATQDSAIGIVPVKVISGSATSSKAEDDALKAKTLAAVNDWLKNPLTSKLIAKLVGAADEIKLIDHLNEEFDLYFENEKLRFYFVDQLKEAIAYVGEQKIKIANISMGMASDKKVSQTAPSLENTLKESSEQLLLEFLKFEVGQFIRQKAASTIFVIAAGNGGGEWIDSHVKSAIPCDISSPLMKEVEDERAGLIAPNNHINNIVCVVSSRADGHLSPYTVIPLNAIPKVIVRGENVRSFVLSSWDCTGAEQSVQEEFGSISFPTLYGDDQLVNEISGKNLSGTDNTNEQRKLRAAFSTFKALKSELARKRCLEGGPYLEANFSGTSMAAPTVAGYLGHKLIKKMRLMKMSQTDAYYHPEFQPHAVLTSFLDGCVRYGGTSDIKNFAFIPETEICRLQTDPMSNTVKNRKPE